MDKKSIAQTVDIFIWSLSRLNQSPTSMFKDPPPFTGTQEETFAGNMKYYLLESMAVLETYKEHHALDKTIAAHRTGFDPKVIAAADPGLAERTQALVNEKLLLMAAIARHLLQEEKIDLLKLSPQISPLARTVDRGLSKGDRLLDLDKKRVKKYKSSARMMPNGLSPDEVREVCRDVGKLLILYADSSKASLNIGTPLKRDAEYIWTDTLAVEHLRSWMENLTAYVADSRPGHTIRFETIPPVALRGEFAAPPIGLRRLHH